MRVVVFSQVRLFGEALAGCLRDSHGIGEAESVYRLADFIKKVEELVPDIVLFDVANCDAIEDARRLKACCPSTHLLALALPEVSEQVIACADAGFIGYIPRDASIGELIKLMRTSLKNELICSPRITHALFQEMRRRQKGRSASEAHKPLTPREQQVIRLLSMGFSNKGIANKLHLSEATVKNHLHNVFVKLGVHKRTEAIALLRDEPWLAESA